MQHSALAGPLVIYQSNRIVVIIWKFLREFEAEIFGETLFLSSSDYCGCLLPWHTNISILQYFAAPEYSFDTACASNFWPIWSPAAPIKFKSPDCRTHIWLIILPRFKTRRGLISEKCLLRILPTNQDEPKKKEMGSFLVGILRPEAVMGKTGELPPGRTNNPILSSCCIFLPALPPSSISFLASFPLIWERDLRRTFSLNPTSNRPNSCKCNACTYYIAFSLRHATW